MPPIKWTEKKIERMIKEGSGSGTGKNYKPWLQTINAGSKGNNNNYKGWKSGREHHFLSRLESQVSFAFEWADEVVDIREQYPLERVKTLNIAEELGINHPTYDGTGVSTVMTTDILLTLKIGAEEKFKAVSVKPYKELENKRVMEKLEIEKTYWKRKGVEWYLATDKDVNAIFTENMDGFHSKRDLSHNFEQGYLDDLTSKLVKGLHYSTTSFQAYFNEFDSQYNLTEGTAILLFKHCLANKRIEIDMFQLLRFNRKVKDLLIPDAAKEGAWN